MNGIRKRDICNGKVCSLTIKTYGLDWMFNASISSSKILEGPKKRWLHIVKEDMRDNYLNNDNAKGRSGWTDII